jgi:hypothetical protein
MPPTDRSPAPLIPDAQAVLIADRYIADAKRALKDAHQMKTDALRRLFFDHQLTPGQIRALTNVPPATTRFHCEGDDRYPAQAEANRHRPKRLQIPAPSLPSPRT